jgi:intracellular multiplication protein IcmC
MTLAVEGIENFIQRIGWIAIARGLVILKRVGDGTTRETSDKAFVRIIGGAVAANVVGGAIFFAHTFGLSLPILRGLFIGICRTVVLVRGRTRVI